MRLVLALLLILCAISASAQSTKSPAPKTTQETQSNNAQPQVRKTPKDKDISKQSQPAVSTESNVTANYYEDQDKDKGKTKPDWWLAIFTFALVVVGILQWLVLRKHETWMQRNVEMVTKVADAADANAKAIAAQSGIMSGQIEAIESQNRTMQESVTATKEIAEATQNSVEAVISKERARIKIIAQPLKIVVGPKVVACWLENYGPTPAFVRDLRVKFLYTAIRDFVPDYSQCQLAFYDESVQGNNPLTEDQVMSIRKGESFLHFYGFANYRDVFERDRRTTVHIRWFMRWGGQLEAQIMEYWELVGTPEENADK
jgi:hypothetical protein